MDIKSALVYWNDWWQNKSVDVGVLRQKYTSRINEFISTREIIVLEGARQSGKTTLMHQTINDLLSTTEKSNICYINLDDVRFGHDLEKIHNAYLELTDTKGKIYFLIDEIQNIPLWEKWVKSKYDKDRNIKFIISGSTSSLLSKEYGYLLSGRYFRISVMPLSFAEILEFRKIDISTKVSIIKNKTQIRKVLSEYLEFGGFPEVVLEDNENIRRERLKTYFESILLKDVILKNNIRNTDKIENLAYYFLSNVSSQYNYSKLAKVLNISTLAAESYFSYIKDSFLIDSTAIFSYKLKDQLQFPRKIYCIDSGIRNAVSFRFRENIGQLYENAVFVELKRRRKDIYYWMDRSHRETDFVVKEGLKVKEAIQVSYSMDDQETKDREIKSLVLCMNEFNLKQGMIITEDYEAKEDHSGKKIVFTPLWKWLLNI